MKTISLLVVFSSLALATLARSGEQVPAGSAPPAAPATTINVPTTAADLATGYAAAVQQMSLKGLVIYVRGEKDIVVLKGIRAVNAVGGVLLVTFSGGDKAALNAEKVVMITDGAHAP
ncbi:MAG: hypothetical protein HY302_01885 [Opitutae bacterium]|nr:hypothetical protein [Opitutae bacterium]